LKKNILKNISPWLQDGMKIGVAADYDKDKALQHKVPTLPKKTKWLTPHCVKPLIAKPHTLQEELQAINKPTKPLPYP